MLTFLAAALPIIGSLYAAASYLIEKGEIEHEYRVRRRLAPAHQERFDRLLPEAKARAARMGVEFDMDVFMHDLNQIDARMHEVNGVQPRVNIRTHDLNASMTRPRQSAVESRRQWALLLSSAVGLVLLAIDGM